MQPAGPGLFSHPLMKRSGAPSGLLEFLASGRMQDICPSVTLCVCKCARVCVFPGARAVSATAARASLRDWQKGCSPLSGSQALRSFPSVSE